MFKQIGILLISFIIPFLAVGQKDNSHFQSIHESLLNTKNNIVMIAAHRGAHNLVPENSLASIREGIKMGIDIVELDIRFTSDRRLVLMHNKTIDGTTDGKGLVTDYTFEEIRKFKLKHNGQVTEEVIPTLEEALLIAKGKILIDLDIKQ